MVGCVGAIGVRSIAWWEGSVTLASFIHRYEEHGGGDLPAFSWAWADAPPYARIGEVDTLDGFLLVLSPWAVRNVRFDESLGQLARLRPRLLPAGPRAGRKVMTADFRAIHHHSLELVPDPEGGSRRTSRWRRSGTGRMPGIGTGPGHLEGARPARRGETEAARAVDLLERAAADAQVRDLGRLAAPRAHPLEDHAPLRSISWRVDARRLRR